MKVAFASQHAAHIDAHLGWARHLILYDVSDEGCRHLGTVRFRSTLVPDGRRAKLLPKMRALRDRAMVFVSAVGPEA